MTMQDWVKELNYFLSMNRKDILKGAGKVSHEEALNHAKKEYSKYKNRIALSPSEVELHYLQSIKDLEIIDTKNRHIIWLNQLEEFPRWFNIQIRCINS